MPQVSKNWAYPKSKGGKTVIGYTVSLNQRQDDWLNATSKARKASKGRILKELIDAAMQWDEETPSHEDVIRKTVSQSSSLRNA